MIFGYSYTYEDIINEISRLKALGEEVIDINSIKIQEVPQMFDPTSSSDTRKHMQAISLLLWLELLRIQI